MKIILINPNTDGHNRLKIPVPPYGLASLAAIAKERGHQVRIWDQFATEESPEDLADNLVRHKPDLIGISCLTPAEPASRRIFRLYREKGGRGLTVMGSVHATVFHESLVGEGVCDIVVRREGEGPFGDLLDVLDAGKPLETVKGITFRDGKSLVVTEDHESVRDLDSLPIPAWEEVEGGIGVYNQAPPLGLFGRTLPILGSRGCPKRCVFCGQEIFHKGLRVRSLDNLLDEIEFLKNQFGMKNFVFQDANFPISRKYGMMFCDGMIKRGLDRELGWSTEIRVSMVDRELLKKLAGAGCRNIEYGFETGDQKILDDVGKGTTIEQAINAMRWTKEAGIHTFGLFMIGLPGETPRHAFKTLRLAMKLDCNIVKFNITVPYPGCELFERHREELLRHFDPETYNSWFQSDDLERNVTVVPGGMSPNTLVFLQRLMLLIYFLRPRIFFKHLRKKTLRPQDFVGGARFLFGGLWHSLWRVLVSAKKPARRNLKKGQAAS